MNVVQRQTAANPQTTPIYLSRKSEAAIVYAHHTGF